jgi:DNA polymerase-3 subunit chi
MTQIDFYVLEKGGRGDRFALTCRLVERIHAADRAGPQSSAVDKHLDTSTEAPTPASPPRVLIYCPDPQEARHLDRLLWRFREDSFLPHGLVGETDPALTPVLISTDGQPEQEDQVLINLSASNEAPPFFSRFERLCEPLDQDPQALQAGRKRYCYYRDCGYALRHHKVS